MKLLTRIDAFGDSHPFTAIVLLAFAVGYVARIAAWMVR